MNNAYELMKQWQQNHDEPVRLDDPKGVKFYITFDAWSRHFMVESCVGYLNFGMVYFSSQQKAKEFLAAHESDLKEALSELTHRYKN